MNKTKIILLSLLAVVLLLVLRTLSSPGVRSFMNGDIPVQKPLSHVIKWAGIPGPEDLEISYNQGLIFISSEQRRNNKGQTGSLYVIDLKKPLEKQTPIRLDIDYPKEFHPHGMSIREMGDRSELYVISHRPGGIEKIEIFLVRRINDSINVIYKDSLTFDGPYNPNDLVVLPNGRFILSHDSKKGRNQYFDIMFNIKRAPLSYFDGLHFSTLRHQTVMGNGIIYRVENNKQYIYRADTIQMSIDKLELITLNNRVSFKFIKRIKLPSSPDNLSLDQQGNIYAACHYSLGKFVAHATDRNNYAPSQVYKIDSQDNITLIYANDGSEYSGASVAVPVGNRLYLGQVFDDGVMVGEME